MSTPVTWVRSLWTSERIHPLCSSFGVSYVWVLDPRTKRVYVHTADGSHEVREALRTQNPEIVVPLSEIFSAG